LELHGSTVTSDAGLLAYREFDDALEMTSTAPSGCTTLAPDRTFQLGLRPRPDLYGQPVGLLPRLSVIVLLIEGGLRLCGERPVVADWSTPAARQKPIS
jgi:hypothetical protein